MESKDGIIQKTPKNKKNATFLYKGKIKKKTKNSSLKSYVLRWFIFKTGEDLFKFITKQQNNVG